MSGEKDEKKDVYGYPRSQRATATPSLGMMAIADKDASGDDSEMPAADEAASIIASTIPPTLESQLKTPTHQQDLAAVKAAAKSHTLAYAPPRYLEPALTEEKEEEVAEISEASTNEGRSEKRDEKASFAAIVPDEMPPAARSQQGEKTLLISNERTPPRGTSRRPSPGISASQSSQVVRSSLESSLARSLEASRLAAPGAIAVAGVNDPEDDTGTIMWHDMEEQPPSMTGVTSETPNIDDDNLISATLVDDDGEEGSRRAGRRGSTNPAVVATVLKRSLIQSRRAQAAILAVILLAIGLAVWAITRPDDPPKLVTSAPSASPSDIPSSTPTTSFPTMLPSQQPTESPSQQPSPFPSVQPSMRPSITPGRLLGRFCSQDPFNNIGGDYCPEDLPCRPCPSPNERLSVCIPEGASSQILTVYCEQAQIKQGRPCGEDPHEVPNCALSNYCIPCGSYTPFATLDNSICLAPSENFEEEGFVICTSLNEGGTLSPTIAPTAVPTPMPTQQPTPLPTPQPTSLPTPLPTVQQTVQPTPANTGSPVGNPPSPPAPSPPPPPSAPSPPLPPPPLPAPTPRPTPANTVNPPVFSPPPTFAPVTSPTMVPSADPVLAAEVREVITTAFPAGAQALDDPTSPQSQAFQVLLQDPSLASYTDEIILERYSLIVLFFSTNGDQWRASGSWLSSSNVCEWDGIVCNNGSVAQVRLADNLVAGILPSELFLLSSLVFAGFFSNDLSGTIPSELGLLSTLVNLDLDSNNIGGTIPTELARMTQVEYLYLSNNQLSGTIPTQLGALTNLRNLLLSNNRLSGTVPDEVCALADIQLTVLSVDEDIGCTCTAFESCSPLA